MVSNALERSKNTDNTESLASSDDVASVTNLVIASMVLCFLRNPYWLLHKISFCVRKEYTLLCTTFSNSLESVGRSDMGLQFEKSSLALAL